MKEMALTIMPDGKIEFHASGFSGKVCETELEKVLKSCASCGVQSTVLEKKITPDSYGGMLTEQQKQTVNR